MKPLIAACTALVLCALAATAGFVILLGGSATPAAASCGPTPISSDGSPTILGGSALSAAQVTAWFEASHGPSSPIGVSWAALVGSYEAHGNAENVRWDYAVAQAVVETGAFSSPAAHRNNFAGIGISSSGVRGFDYPSPDIGALAHIELLHKVAAGNGAPLAEPDVAPNWGGRSGLTTWASLTGNWATAPDYWTVVSGVYARMSAGQTPSATLVSAGGLGCPTGGGAGPSCLPGAPGATTTTSVTAGAATPLDRLLSWMCSKLGIPYLWGGSSDVGYDCSGLMQAGFASIGVIIPRTSETQYAALGAHMVPPDQLQPGDLVFMDGVPPGHVAIVMQAAPPGGLPIIEDAPHTGAVVHLTTLWGTTNGAYVGAARPSIPAQ